LCALCLQLALALLSHGQIVNGGFEADAVLNSPPTTAVSGWGTFGPVLPATASANNDPTRTGIGSLKLTGAGGFGVPGGFQTLPASPGQVWDLKGYGLTRSALPADATFGLLKIVFGDSAGNALPMSPQQVLIGNPGPPEFPGAESLPIIDHSSPPNAWILTQARGIAPAGTEEVAFFVLFVDESVGSIYFDDVEVTTIEPVEPENLIQNPGFEEGTTGWFGFGFATLSAPTTLPHTGNRSVLVEDRTDSWNGVAQSLLGVLQPATTYRISAWVRLASGPAQPVKLTFRQIDDSGTSFPAVASGTAGSAGWTQLIGSFTPVVNGTLTYLTLYLEGPAPGVSFYADDFEVVPLTVEPFSITSSGLGGNGQLTLAWGSYNNHLYEIQTTEELPTQTNWTVQALMIGEDQTSLWTNSDVTAYSKRFYRVQRFRFADDEDEDELSNLTEFNLGTDLHSPDSDDDGLPDPWEVQYDFDPLDPGDAHLDLDGDEYTNLQEQQLRTKPNASYSRPAGLPPSLVAWWKLDEGTGTNVLDSSLNRHNGFVLGDDPAGAWTTGYLSNAITVGGPSDNWIEVPYHISLTPTQELTLTGWVKPSGQGTLIGNWDSIGQVYGNYRLQFGPEEIELWFSPAGDGSCQVLQFNPAWSSNEWHHVAVSYDGNSLAVFVDGALQECGTVMGPVTPVPNPILIGFPGQSEAALVDEVRIYGRALGTNEIASLSLGNGLPVTMIVGQTATLRAFGASVDSICQWSVVSGEGLFTNTANCTTGFRPSWSGTVTLQVVVSNSVTLHTNVCHTAVTFPSLSPILSWNVPEIQPDNNCYNFATDIRTDTFAQPGEDLTQADYYCPNLTSACVSDGLQAGVDLGDLCHTSGLPAGHVIALLAWPNTDFHFVRLQPDGMWAHKGGWDPATTLDESGRPITDPRTADWGPYVFCGFLWVGPDVQIE